MAVSIHAPREGCDGRNVPSQESQETVSIHAPREGCDSSFNMPDNVRSGFNSRTPGGVRLHRGYCLFPSSEFQFTHPGRGATPRGASDRYEQLGFNSRTPGGVRRAYVPPHLQIAEVSIHAPREGCDSSTDTLCSLARVSIHAPREGCDLSS